MYKETIFNISFYKYQMAHFVFEVQQFNYIFFAYWHVVIVYIYGAQCDDSIQETLHNGQIGITDVSSPSTCIISLR
jgi:hypothetical protein